MCGLKWQSGTAWDGTTGVGQEMAALEVIQSNLIAQVRGPVTNSTGGTSKGDYSAGTTSVSPTAITPATEADRVGAGFVTTVVLACFVGMVWWMIV
jgi:mannan endo-1,6-alpha-mannosidase